MDEAWEAVAEFHRAFGAPAENSPCLLAPPDAAARAAWMREEIDEFLEAADIPGQADAMTDLIYFALGTLVQMGVRPQALFNIVHAANMRKLHPDGKPRRRADGKVVKPEGWQDPEPLLIEELTRQGMDTAAARRSP
ncbi:MAG: hypothetical protein LBI44_04970 [Oscillospiraceae bacterium]|jgi:predicted HAD superfamily Cof-like phosphohydrolase|nr:hypothetical protein [Oscillospiraceae bacterium]